MLRNSVCLRVPRQWMAFASILAAALSVAGAAISQPLTLADAADQRAVSDPQISPDGSLALVIVGQRNFDENRTENQLFLVDVESGESRALTFDRHRVSNPRWSPDGQTIAFLALDDDGQNTIHLLALSGGEARSVARPTTGVESFEWSPDGERLGFVATLAPEEKEGQEKHNRSYEVGGDWYLADQVSPARHLWVVGMNGDEPEQLTTEHSLAYLAGSYAWDPDSKSLVYSAQPDSYTTSFLRGSVRRVGLDGTEGALIDEEEPSVYAFPRPSPDGAHVAYLRARGPAPSFYPNAVFTVPRDGGTPKDQTAALDRDLDWVRWSADGKSLWVGGYSETTLALWHQPVGGSPTRVDLGGVHFRSGDVASDGRLLFVGSSSSHPAELYVLDNVDAQPRRLTDFNATLSARDLGKVETVYWTNDGFEQDGVLIYPPDFEDDKRYPLVLMIHGGPMGTSSTAFNFVGQVAAARSWLVFQPNYRGSNNRGAAFQSSVVGDAGAGPGRDVMAGVEALKTRGIVDSSRMASTGWSYGGYMTVWLTSHYDVWRAAVAGAAVTDWFDWYTLSDISVWSGYGLGGSPWKNGNDAHYREQSPITYASRIKTPMLILSTTLDPRVSVTQSFKLYSVLRDHDVPVKFVAYPVPGHFPGDPVHWRDVYERWFDWIETHFDDE